MAKCGWCGTTQLSLTKDGLESHNPSWSTRPCEGFSTYLTKPSATLRPSAPRVTSYPSRARLEGDVVKVNFPKTLGAQRSKSA
jgi:hypothetical protein